MMPDRFADNADRSRFELNVDGAIVFADYRRMGDSIAITHVEAPLALRGTGAAGRLMGHVAGIARAEGRDIIPLCGYAAAWMQRHAKA